MLNFIRDMRGNTAIVFALSGFALVAAVGAALDINDMEAAKTSLNAAADAGVLAAVKAAEHDFTNGGQNWQTFATVIGKKAFLNDLPANMQDATYTGTLALNANSFTGTATYAWKYPAKFMGMFGYSNLDVTRTVVAGQNIENYLDIHLLIDVSPSMGIGATDADQTLMHNSVGPGGLHCALACHYKTAWSGSDNYAAMRATGATFRIDVVRAATQKFISDLQTRAASSNQIMVSVDLYSNRLIPLIAPTTDLTAAATAAAAIDLQNSLFNAGTNTERAMADLAGKIPSSGPGWTPTSRKAYTVILTDGTENSTQAVASSVPGLSQYQFDPAFAPNSPNFNFDATERVQTIDPSACAPLKAKGETVLTAHMQYLIPSAANGGGDSRYVFIQNNLIAASQAAFQACATSPSLAFSAATTPDVTAMYNNILNAILPPTNLALTK